MRKSLLILGVILCLFFISFADAKTITFNYNSTYANKTMFGMKTTQSSSECSNNPPIGYTFPTCINALFTSTDYSNVASIDTNYLTSSASSNYVDQLFYLNLTNATININDTSLINWTYKMGPGNSNTYTYIWNSTNWTYQNHNNLGNSYMYNWTSNNKYWNDSYSYLLVSSGYVSNFGTDYVKVEVTYNSNVNVTLSTPINNTNSTNRLQYFVCNSNTSSVYLSNLTLYIYNNTGIYKTNSTLITGTSNSTNVSINFTQDGTYKWNCIVNNTDGVSNSSNNNTIIIDSTPPNINFTNPTETTSEILERNNIFINITTSDTNFKNITINIYNSIGSSVYTNNSTSSPFYVNATGFSDGNYSFNATAYDIFGNSNSTETRNVTIDLADTAIQYVSPTQLSGVSLNRNYIEINTTGVLNMIGLDIINISLFNSSNNLINNSASTTSPFYVNYTNLPNGVYSYNVTRYSTLNGNSILATRTITLDTVNPNATLLNPLNNSFNNTNQNFTVNLTDNLGLKNITLYIWNSTGLVNQTSFSLGTGTIQTIGIVVNLIDNIYKWFYNIFDNAGNSYITGNFTFTKDTINPSINITTPINGTNSSNVNLNINYTINDTNLNSCWYSNDTYSLNTSISCGTNITTVTWVQGNHNLTIWANDSAGNANSSSISFFIDNIAPTITINYPNQGNTYTANSNLQVNFTRSDSGVGLSSCWWSNDTAIHNYTLIPVFSQNITFSHSDVTNAYIYIWCNDSLNNIASNNLLYSISTTNPAINLVNPTNNIWFNNGTNINFNFTVQTFGTTVSQCQLWGNWTGTWKLNQTNSSAVTGDGITVYNFNKLNLTDNQYSWNVWCNDSNSRFAWDSINYTFGIDTIKPNLNLSKPLNQTYTTNLLTLNYSVNDTNLNTCWYNINNTANITIPSCNNISFIASQGSSTIYLFVNDSAGNLNQTNITFFVDSINPFINVSTSFTNGSYLNYNTSIAINVSVRDNLNLNSCWYTDNSGNNIFFTCGNNLSLNLSETLHTINISVNDSLNNINSTSISFIPDVTFPNVTITSISQINTSQNLLFNFTASDINLNYCNYTFINATSGVLDSSAVIPCNIQKQITASNYGDWKLTVYAFDFANNYAYYTNTLTLSASSPIIISSGGGGGGKIAVIPPIIIIGNSTWKMYSSESGGSSFNLEMTSFATRTGEIYLYNNGADVLNITLRCEGNLCDYLTLDRYNISLPVGKNIPTVIKFNIKILKEIKADKYIANIIGIDQYGQSNLITITSNVGGIGFIGKIIGDFFSISPSKLLKLPYLLINVIIYIIFFCLLFFSAFGKKIPGGKVFSFVIPIFIVSIMLIFI